MITSFHLKIESIVITLLSQQRKYVWLPMAGCRQPRSFAMIILAQRKELLKKIPIFILIFFTFQDSDDFFKQLSFLCVLDPVHLSNSSSIGLNIIARQRSCGKVMFSFRSVCSQGLPM